MDVIRAPLVVAFVLVSAAARGDDAKPVVSTEEPRPTKRAEEPSSKPSAVAHATAADDALLRIVDRPHTIAEVEVGFIALPNAPISAGQRGGDVALVGKIGRGDATLQTGIHVLYRWNRSYAVGAGAFFAPSPTSATQAATFGQLPRTNARSYFFLGVEGRYIPIHYKYFEAWVGLSSGAVVVADRFTTESAADVPAILGAKEVTIRTEGLAVGAQAGGTYYLSENWLLGLNLRGYHWILPETPRCSPIGDCATLGGSAQVFELGLTVGYRLPL